MPFGAIAGMHDAKLALRLLALEPRLNGVLVAAGRGVGKSTLARAFGQAMGGLVEVPAGVTADRLLGALDVEGMLHGDAPRIERGLLARADGKVLSLDNAHLLAPWAAQQIVQCVNRGYVRLEREGVSATIHTRFVLVASFDPEEGEIAAALRDAVGLHVFECADTPLEQRIAVMKGPAKGSPPLAGLRKVVMCEDAERRIVSAAVELGIEGHRADGYAVLAARASAAAHGRLQVQEADVETAMRLVLFPRAHSPCPQKAGAPRPHESAGNAVEDDPDTVTMAPIKATVPEQAIETGERVSRDRGRYVRAAAQGGRIAVDATIRAAAPFQRLRPPGPLAIRITADDVRFREYRRREATLVIFALDASGSMASARLREAKGAAIHLLHTAYLRRAKVALVSFRGSAARVLLEPTRSVMQAKRVVDALPAGGATPLAAGLETALRVARSQRHTGCDTLLVLLTDGRANVARQGAVQEDLAGLCRVVQEDGLTSLVIDTARQFTRTGEAERVARMLGGRYVRLPRSGAQEIAGVIDAQLARGNL